MPHKFARFVQDCVRCNRFFRYSMRTLIDMRGAMAVWVGRPGRGHGAQVQDWREPCCCRCVCILQPMRIENAGSCGSLSLCVCLSRCPQSRDSALNVPPQDDTHVCNKMDCTPSLLEEQLTAGAAGVRGLLTSARRPGHSMLVAMGGAGLVSGMALYVAGAVRSLLRGNPACKTHDAALHES